MNSNRLILLLLLLVVFGGLVAWLLSRPAESPRINQEFDAVAGRPLDAGEPLPVGDPADPAGNQPARKLPPDALTPEDTPPAEPESSALADEETETPITPVYAPAILRGRASARFELLDGNHQPLHAPEVKTSLWRRVGMRWCHVDSGWDEGSRCVVCNGNFHEGLEPGEYELEIDAGHYGFLLHQFSLLAGQAMTQSLSLANFRRIVTFRFLRPDGTLVDWVDSYATVQTTRPEVEEIERLRAPKWVLRSPPTARSSVGLGGGIGNGRSSGGFKRRASMMATDAGRVHVAVIAGAHNVVTFRMDPEIWGTDLVQFEGEFLEDQWSDFVVELKPAEDFEARTTEHYRWSLDDPGRRSLLNWVTDYLTPKAFDVESAIPIESHVRVIIECDLPVEASLLCGFSTKGDALTGLTYEMERRGKHFFVDVDPGTVLYYGLYIDDERIGPLSSHTVTEQRIQRIKYEPQVAHITAVPWKVSPTVDQWTLHSRLDMEVRVKDEQGRVVRTECRLYAHNGGYWLGNDVAAALADAFGVRHQLQLSAKYSRKWRDYTGLSNSREHHWKSAGGGVVEGDVARGLLTGSFEPGKPTRGLALRAVSGGEGLPWVHCSIVPWKKDELCRRLRDVESELKAEGQRPWLGQKFAEDFEWERDALTEEGIDPERMKEHMGEEFIKRVDGKPELAWYARNGAWYDTHRKLETDDCGYAVDFEMQLTPGELYVLYAWSNSRDDLQPDVRIVFRATEGLTDIGAITLPAYTE